MKELLFLTITILAAYGATQPQLINSVVALCTELELQQGCRLFDNNQCGKTLYGFSYVLRNHAIGIATFENFQRIIAYINDERVGVPFYQAAFADRFAAPDSQLYLLFEQDYLLEIGANDFFNTLYKPISPVVISCINPPYALLTPANVTSYATDSYLELVMFIA
jgi:hypothetical protein